MIERAPAASDGVVELEWVEPLPEFDLGSRWHVREAGVARVAWVLHENGSYDDKAIAGTCLDWRGFAHPRASAIRHVGRYGGKLVVLVEDDRGPSLADAAAQLADTPIDRERWVIAQVITIADALATMAKHAPKFVYREIHADRLYVDHTGRGRIRAPVSAVIRPRGPMTTGAGVAFGDPRWMAPEQALGTPVTPATDVFALAANLAYAVTGVLPYDDPDGSFMTILQKIIMQPPELRPLQAPGLDAVIARALARESAQRYPDPAAFATALYECVPDAGDYDAVVSDRLAAWWPSAPQAQGAMPSDRSARCSKQWEELQPMTRPDMRFCGSCQQTVVHVRSLAAAIPLVGHCVHYRPD
ncbi:MAG: hypothetical protein ABI867_03700 [Kofleriaceae bacterium]